MAGQFLETLKKSARLTASEWLYVATAVKELLLARTRHATQPAGQILSALRQRSGQHLPVDCALSADLDLQKVAWALTVVASRVPWRADCLVQTMAAARWLRRYHIQPEFHLGVMKDPVGNLRAHAWLEYRGVTITGGETQSFTTLIEPSP